MDKINAAIEAKISVADGLMHTQDHCYYESHEKPLRFIINDINGKIEDLKSWARIRDDILHTK